MKGQPETIARPENQEGTCWQTIEESRSGLDIIWASYNNRIAESDEVLQKEKLKRRAIIDEIRGLYHEANDNAKRFRRTLPFIPTSGPLPVASPDLLNETSPRAQEGAPSYRSIKLRARSALVKEWNDQFPPPPTYPYQVSLSPHPFMGLGRFMAGRIHQMRSGKSYLAAHPSWFTEDPSPLCPFCEEEEEDFAHAILYCESRKEPRERHLRGLTSLDRDSPLWSNTDALLSLARYINVTATGFPPGMPPSAWDPPLPPDDSTSALPIHGLAP
ncbi:hypothetical protein HOY80DRAFT_1043733 [Tuber brumale]|nr:hypothetical protein HOY80DRAFT_1043733 [Tuber brumale]